MTFITLVLFIAGLGLLIAGANFLVRGASRFAAAMGISPLVIGLTVVAFGTSAPEAAISVMASLRGEADLSFGNVIGSNLFNILFILGISAAVSPLVVSQKLVRIDVPIMIAAALLMTGLAWEGSIGRLDGVLLFTGLIAYTLFSVRSAWREKNEDVQDQYARELGKRTTKGHRSTLWNFILVFIGLFLLIIGSRWLVAGAVDVAMAFGVSELIIGLTIVAAGTSLPEVATSILAAVRGERDIAVGNIVGSNIFNILGVLGLAGIVSPDGISVSSAAMRFDVPVMITASVACLPIFFRGHRISRWEGFLLFGYYIAYAAFLILNATKHDALPVFSQIMLIFVIPLTALTFGVVWVRSYLRRGSAGSQPEFP